VQRPHRAFANFGVFIMPQLPRSRRLALIAAIATQAAAAQQAAVEPTSFESWILQPDVVVEFEQLAGSIVSSDASLEVTGVIAADTANPLERRHGLRLRFTNNAGQDQIHLDRAHVTVAIDDLGEIESGIAELESGNGAPWRVQGTARCWRPARPMRILCPGYGIGPEGAGLQLAAYGGSQFTFPGRRPAELSLLMEQALALLASRCPPMASDTERCLSISGLK
jgi:hypothetical protein